MLRYIAYEAFYRFESVLCAIKLVLQRNKIGREILRKHIGDAIDDMGQEIDDIEREVKSNYPEIKHVDLEVH